MKKMLFIYNPYAGKGLIKNKLSDILEIFVNADYEVTIYPTKERKDATNIVMTRGKDFDIVVCSGGDGTLNEVTDGLMELKQKPFCGYIPAGTINDFASSLNIPKDMLKAAKNIVEGIPFSYDIGSLNGDFFTYIAAFGAFTDVPYDTSQAAKNILGKLAYFLEGVKRLPTIKSYTMTIQYDDKEIKDNFIFGMFSNSNSIGGFKGLNGSNVKLDDGLFEAALIKMPQNIVELHSIVNALLTRELNNEYMYSFLASKIKVYSDVVVPWTIDGEFGGEFKKSVVENHKQAVSYIKPKVTELRL